MLSDPISDMLTRIRNASLAKKGELVLPYSNMKYDIAKILEKEGYVASVQKALESKHQVIRITLKYNGRQSAISSLKRISKPGRRVYAKSKELPYVLSDMGMAIVSTPNGVMSSKEARSRKLGGEVICEVY